MKKRRAGKWILGGLLLALVLAQFIQPVRLEPARAGGRDALATNAPPPEIAALLRAACYDCHSSETDWPWYGRVAPVSWWLTSHVNDARRSLNFSDWPHGEPQREARRWHRVAESISSGTMPLPSYARVHSAARLSAEQRERLVQWAEAEAQRLLELHQANSALEP